MRHSKLALANYSTNSGLSLPTRQPDRVKIGDLLLATTTLVVIAIGVMGKVADAVQSKLRVQPEPDVHAV